jgi:CubicO group peptidase (beta-lactamase class C family)
MSELKAEVEPSEVAPFAGVGFGLGFAVTIDPVPGKVICSEGELTWGGAASTMFWIDPGEGLTASFFTQLLPSSAFPVRSQLRSSSTRPWSTRSGVA